MVNKKAQGLSITTIILIVLGVFVLVALIFGFTQGWSGIKGFINPGNNLNDVLTQCNIACTTDDTYNYCTDKREVKIDGEIKHTRSCDGLKKLSGNPYGIKDCNIQCPENPNSLDPTDRDYED